MLPLAVFSLLISVVSSEGSVTIAATDLSLSLGALSVKAFAVLALLRLPVLAAPDAATALLLLVCVPAPADPATF